MGNGMEGSTRVAEGQSFRAGPFVVRLILGLSISIFLIWQVDFSQVVAALTHIDPTWLIMAFLVQIVGKFIWAWRWSILLDIFEIPVEFWKLVKGIYIGLFFSNFLPTNIGGDFYRGYWILDDKQLYRKSMFVIFIERLIGFASLGYIAVPAFLWFLFHGLQLGDSQLLLPFLIGILCVSVFVLHPKVFATLERLLFRPGSTLFLDLRSKVSQSLRVLHEAGTHKWQVYLYSFATQLTGIVFFYCIGNSLGLPLQIWHYFVIVPITVTAMLLPVTFNGLGVREGVLTLLIVMLTSEVSSAQAVALGLLSLVVGLAVSLIGGGFYIVGDKREPVATPS